MKILKNILVFTIILSILTSFNSKVIDASSNISMRKAAKIGVVFYELNHPYLSLIQENLEKIQKENPNKVEFTFFDCKKNSSIQLQNINEAIDDEFDVLILTIVEQRNDIINNFILKAKQKGIPLIFYASTIPKTDTLKNYPKAFIVNEDNKETAIMLGKFIVDLWNTNRAAIDNNGDNILQYIQLRGYPNNPLDIQRATYSIETINNLGVKTQELQSVFAYWDQELAENQITSLFLKYGNKIEAIITNGDALAIGAVKALQKYGYNKGDESKSIIVVGFDALPEAIEMVDKGFMTGTFYIDFYVKSKALYDVSMNLISDKNPIEGTDLKIHDKEIFITGKPKQYTITSNN